MTEVFTDRVRTVISLIPYGMVTTYGIIADRAGHRTGARQVARILHTSSTRYNLPWHRVVNRHGKISLSPGNGYETQKKLLEKEGIHFDTQDRIDFDRHLWLGTDVFQHAPQH